MAIKNKVIAGIIGAAVIGLGITAVVFSGGLAAIAFLAVGSVASAAIMYGGIEQDRKAEMGARAYRSKYGYGYSGGIQEIGNFFKRLGGKKEKDEIPSTPEQKTKDKQAPEVEDTSKYKGKFNNVLGELKSLKREDDSSNILPSNMYTPKETHEVQKLRNTDKSKVPDNKEDESLKGGNVKIKK